MPAIDGGDFASGGIGALFGSIVTILSFRGRLKLLEKESLDRQKECSALWTECKLLRTECKELRIESLAVSKDIQDDIKNLIEKTAQRRRED